MAHDCIVLLGATCDASETPKMGMFNGVANQKEYYFTWRSRYAGIEKEIKEVWQKH